MRIDRILANSGLGSRTECKALLKEGRVTLAGKVLLDPAQHIPDMAIEMLLLDGEPILMRKYLYYLLHKPAGYLTAMDDRRQATIADLLPAFFRQKNISPVGRLDKDTTGLLILTNDGQLTHRLLSPRYGIVRRYYVEVTLASQDHPFTAEDVRAVAAGIRLNDEEQAKPAQLEPLTDTSAYLDLTEGKFHEVKRIMHALAKEVTSLHRLSYGSLHLDIEKPGDYRALTDSEILDLYKLTGLSGP